jgi:hypothetical protein
MVQKLVKFRVAKDFVRTMSFEDADSKRKYRMYRLTPTLGDWKAGEIPDEINPRSHGPQCLKGRVAKDIKKTLLEDIENFHLRNRGSLVLADQNLTHYDPNSEQFTIGMSEWTGDDAIHGMPDGATTDAVLKLVQSTQVVDAEKLMKGRINIEVITGIEDRDTIINISEARNTSKQVKSSSIADFKGQYDWLREKLSEKFTEALDGNHGKIGYDENADCDVDVLEILCILHLFHPAYRDGKNQPHASYTGKGKMSEKLSDDEMINGFKQLKPLTFEILELHDYVICTFEDMYKGNANGRQAKKLGGLGEHGNKCFKKINEGTHDSILPFSNYITGRIIPRGVLYPLLASFRALIKCENGAASWIIEPKTFWEKHGPQLVEALFEMFGGEFNQNPNKIGKSISPYRNLYNMTNGLMLTELLGKQRVADVPMTGIHVIV